MSDQFQPCRMSEDGAWGTIALTLAKKLISSISNFQRRLMRYFIVPQRSLVGAPCRLRQLA